MAKAKVKQRKDSKGRVLQKGESQRKLDGMYIYTYVNPYGKRCYVYSKDLFTLREKEQELIKAQMDGLDYYVGGHATINMTCISVNHAATYYTRNGVAGFAISRPKTEAGIRQIPMMDAVYNALKNEYDRQKKDGFCTYELDGVSGFIFSNKLGLLHNPHCVNLAIKRIYEAHNAREIIDAKREHREPVIIPHFSCHVLRHTFCSRLCESDMNVKVIQEIMGHKNVETTLDIYTEVNYNKKKDSLEELASKMQFF